MRTSDGVRLRYVLWSAPDPQATLYLLTGRTEFADKYAAVCARFAAEGYRVAAIDWRGQGLSDRLLDDPKIGHVGSFADYQRDLDAVIGDVEAEGAPLPRLMLAHSLGGAIGLRALVRGVTFRAAAFSAPMWGIRVSGPQARLLSRLTGAGVMLGFGARYAPPPAPGPVCYAAAAPFAGNVLTGDEAEWNRVASLLHEHPALQVAGPSIRWLHEAQTECRRLARLPSPPVPALAGLGSHEQIVDPLAIRERMARWPNGHLMFLDGAQHEIMIERAAVRARFLDACSALFRGALN
ncbi:MAG: alpha/beta fold hydrolase [Gemmobacter sp.]